MRLREINNVIIQYNYRYAADGLFRYLERFVLYKQKHSPRRHGGTEKVKNKTIKIVGFDFVFLRISVVKMFFIF